MADRDQILVDFQGFTGIDDLDQCRMILENHNWDLITAVQNAMVGMDSPREEVPIVAEPLIPVPHEPVIPSFLSNVNQDLPPPVYDLTGAGGSGPAAGDMPSVSASHIAPPPRAEASGGLGPVRASRLLNFTIQYKARDVQLVLTDTDNVGRIKELLEDHLGVPKSRQHLGGWVNKNDRRICDDDVLRDLRLPKDNTLFLLTPDLQPENSSSRESSPNVMERLSQTFTLNIRHTDRNKMYKLDFPGCRTIREIKGDIYSLTDIPMRHQVWTGWPPEASDETMTLAGCGIQYPCHNLEVTSSRPSSSHNAAATAHPPDTIDISDDEFEDAHENMELEEDMFGGDESTCRRHQPLMPDEVNDQTMALEHFSREFSNRYGECHPVFYIGSLEDAIKDALQVKAVDSGLNAEASLSHAAPSLWDVINVNWLGVTGDPSLWDIRLIIYIRAGYGSPVMNSNRKLLAIYLHHDSSILANVFCSQVLCAESVVSYLSNNFMTWAWDLSSESNRAMLLTMCTQHFGSVAANTVRNYKPDELPLLLLISRSRSMNEVVSVIQANVSLDELMTQLIHAVEVFQEQQRTEIIEEEQRDARELMKREQDAAYEESLAADRAKALARQEEEEKQREVELIERMRRDREERQQREEEEEKEAIRLSLANQLPEEPPENCGESMARIRFRLPGGDMITRRFLGSNTLQVLLNFIVSKGFDTADYKVLTTFPRRDLSGVDVDMTLESLKLCPQETIILEQKNAQD